MQEEYWAPLANQHLSQDIIETKRQFILIKIILARLLITFLFSLSDWQRLKQGPLMVKFQIKKIFIDNVSFKNV